MDEMTEYKIRQLASQKLEMNLSESKYKAYVRHVVNSFLEEQKAKQEEEAADDDDNNNNNKEYDDDGDLIICRLSEKRKVTIQEFRGKTLVSIREYYKKDGKELPTSKVLHDVAIVYMLDAF
ncbi:Transcriptional coactivator p15 [Corchorus olitorius]|uniref:Transcriptional coactivator p15 n=1 Tax=Corchorus olitorius TaxID=93759 RepID=A0A1R3K764_9ROSI|nr:Transcriptional coactivator p15 [Corchorus olitorius]